MGFSPKVLWETHGKSKMFKLETKILQTCKHVQTMWMQFCLSTAAYHSGGSPSIFKNFLSCAPPSQPGSASGIHDDMQIYRWLYTPKYAVMRVRQCHKPPMIGNGNMVTIPPIKMVMTGRLVYYATHGPNHRHGGCWEAAALSSTRWCPIGP